MIGAQVYEVTVTCPCGGFATERTNHCAIDVVRLRDDLVRRGWGARGPGVDGWRDDTCPKCVRLQAEATP